MIAFDQIFLVGIQVPRVIEEISQTVFQSDVDCVLICFNTIEKCAPPETICENESEKNLKEQKLSGGAFRLQMTLLKAGRLDSCAFKELSALHLVLRSRRAS